MAREALGNCSDGLLALTAWTAALAVHGIYTLATVESERTSARTVMLSFGETF